MTDPPIIRLIEQITGFPRELVLKILGYIPVRRRLTVDPRDPTERSEFQFYNHPRHWYHMII